MSHTPHARHAAPDPMATLRTPRFWLSPIVVALVLFSALAALYLGGILNPTTNLRHFPIAVVNSDTGPSGKQIVDGLVSGLNAEQFDVRVLSADEAATQMGTAQIYGQVQIPADFSAQLQEFGSAAMQPGQPVRPVVTISLGKAIKEIDANVGKQLSAQAARGSGSLLPGGVSLALSSPIDITVNDHEPLPNGTGNGLSAFYYALLLIIAGFTGSILVSSLVDSMLGFVPAELGPVYRFAEQIGISRFRTLLVKWAFMVIIAVLTSAVYIGIASALGMPIPNVLALWLYGVFTAVGISSTSLIAALGSMGLLANLFIFVILGLPSNGATIPLQAAPPLFSWLAKFEPMHQIFLGTRSLLYFQGRADAGLSHSLVTTTVGLIIGLAIGAAVTRFYDRRGLRREHSAAPPAVHAPNSPNPN
jgi:uncharacterized phage infection (PIP) family protein YhgE